VCLYRFLSLRTKEKDELFKIMRQTRKNYKLMKRNNKNKQEQPMMYRKKVLVGAARTTTEEAAGSTCTVNIAFFFDESHSLFV